MIGNIALKEDTIFFPEYSEHPFNISLIVLDLPRSVVVLNSESDPVVDLIQVCFLTFRDIDIVVIDLRVLLFPGCTLKSCVQTPRIEPQGPNNLEGMWLKPDD